MDSARDLATMSLTDQTQSGRYSLQGKRSLSKKTLRPRVALRLLAICFFGCLTGFLIFDSPYWLTGVWTGLITAALFYEMISFVDQSERKLTSFLQALSQNDFSVSFYENRKSDDYDLHHAFNQLGATFKLLRSDKESQHQFLQVIVETAAVPMICFEEGVESVYLINDAAKKLFGIPFLQQIKSLWRIDPSLPGFVRDIRDGEKESLKLVLQDKQVFLSVTSRHIVFKDKNLKLIAFHDVGSELAIKEAETWQKLLRVLTHEISNSAIPLATLSSFIYDMVEKTDAEIQALSGEEKKDLLLSLKTIEQRSRSLKEFVHNFRSVNQVPEPVMHPVSVKSLIDEIQTLFAKELEKQEIAFEVRVLKEPYYIMADRNLTMQVIINLVKNAIEAMANLKSRKGITMSCEKMGRYLNIHVLDTGCGIPPEDLDQIFIPFYSTKGSGMGIGLSISQQIMQRQRGDIAVRSVVGKGSEFILTFMT